MKFQPYYLVKNIPDNKSSKQLQKSILHLFGSDIVKKAYFGYYISHENYRDLSVDYLNNIDLDISNGKDQIFTGTTIVIKFTNDNIIAINHTEFGNIICKVDKLEILE